MIAKFNNTAKKGFSFSITFSIIMHLAIAGILLSSAWFAKNEMSIEGDNSIKAVMIDLSIMAAPEQTLVENTPDVKQDENRPEEEQQQIESIPEEKLKDIEVEPDVIIEKEMIEKLELPKEADIVIKEKPIKPVVKPKNKPVKQFSKPQVKQEVKTDKLANLAVAPTISNNTQLSTTATPINRNHPEYPRRALDLHIEGHVIVRYDIASDGHVENIRIVEAKPNNIFNKTVIQAMKQWKYQPIVSKDLTIKIVFNRNKSVGFDKA